MSVTDPLIIEREFGISFGDFFRIFPRVWPEYERLSDDAVRLRHDDGRCLTVRLGAQQYRRLGVLKIPYLMLSFEFESWSEQQRTEFFEHFDRSFQKGGG